MRACVCSGRCSNISVAKVAGSSVLSPSPHLLPSQSSPLPTAPTFTDQETASLRDRHKPLRNVHACRHVLRHCSIMHPVFLFLAHALTHKRTGSCTFPLFLTLPLIHHHTNKIGGREWRSSCRLRISNTGLPRAVSLCLVLPALRSGAFVAVWSAHCEADACAMLWVMCLGGLCGWTGSCAS